VRLRFGDVVFDPEARAVFRGGPRVPLSPKAYQLLEILVSRRPNAISKADLSEALWPSTFVSEGNLTVLMAEVRRAIGDQPRGGRFIRTVHGFGYALCAESSEPEPSREGDSCSVALGDREIPLCPGANILGRAAGCAVRVDADPVSRRHARIVVAANGSATLEDLASKNGTFLCGSRVVGPTPLANGDVIGLGTVVLRFIGGGALASTRTEVQESGRE
jgi:DNA-binding winged helix-turn-helix (wHTH) protein